MSTISNNSDTFNTDTDASSGTDSDENQIAGTIDSIAHVSSSQQKVDYKVKF